MMGSRPFVTHDNSANNWLVARNHVVAAVHRLHAARDGEMFGQAIADEVDTFDRSSIADATVERRWPPWRIGVPN
jgi:hypothetical protein